MSQQGTTQFDQACDSALGWIARLRSDAATEKDQQSFALWLGQDASHSQAMDQMLDLWDDLGVVAELPASADLPEQAANSARWLPAAIATAACLVLAVFLVTLFQSEPAPQQYRSAMGERLNVELPDGSQALLNTDSTILVTYTDGQRLIELEQGEAWFDVEPNKARPFHVDAGEARVTAIGTAFNIYRLQDSTEIAVTEGVVRVTERGETGARAAETEVLRVNQRLLASPRGWEVSREENMDQQLAWHRGQLVAREMPLPELIAELQRYHAADIIIAEPELAIMTVSGVFDLDTPEATLQAVAVSLGLSATPLDDDTVRLLKLVQ